MEKILYRFVATMFCSKAHLCQKLHEIYGIKKTLCQAALIAGGKNSRPKNNECTKYGFEEGVYLCVRHFDEEKKQLLPKRSEEDTCSVALTNCWYSMWPSSRPGPILGHVVFNAIFFSRQKELKKGIFFKRPTDSCPLNILGLVLQVVAMF